MQYQLLRRILEQEGSSFQRIEQRWKPTTLLYLQQVRQLLFDIRSRFEKLSAAEEELRTLDRADVYIRDLRQMRVYARTAYFTWKSDQLSFIRSVAGFYENYGTVLRLLKIEQARGRLSDGTK